MLTWLFSPGLRQIQTLQGRDLPTEIAQLYENANALTAAANALTERVVNWIPDNLADAIRLLDHDPDGICTQIPRSVLAGLRIIAGAGDPVTAAPVTGDRRILGLFGQWVEAWCHSASIAVCATDVEITAAVAKADQFEDAIAETAAESILGLAVKVFFLYHGSFSSICRGAPLADPCSLNPPDDMIAPGNPEMAASALRDVARLVPELAPFCAPAIAEEKASNT